MTTGCWQVLADVGAGPAGGVRGQGYHPNTRGGSLEGLMFDRSDKGFGYTTQRWPGWPVPSYLIQTTGLTIQLGCWLSVHLVFFSWKFFSEDVRLATYTMSSCPYNGSGHSTSYIQARFLTDLYLPDAVEVAWKIWEKVHSSGTSQIVKARLLTIAQQEDGQVNDAFPVFWHLEF